MLNIRDYIIEAGKCEEAGDRIGLFKALREGLRLNVSDDVYAASEYAYEIYYMLGFYYLESNINQAFLCFQNAYFRCKDENDRIEILSVMNELKDSGQVSVKDTLILIVSYNGQYFLQKCIESVRATVPEGTYRIMVVDNASTDDVLEYLRAQKDIVLVKNSSNMGFSVACNQGVELAGKLGLGDSDVFLLNNDTRLAYDALFWLKMGLYRDNSTGATGSVSNYAGNKQQIEVEFELPTGYLEYGRKNNIPERYPYDDRVRLSGFAMLIKAGLWQQVGGMDEAFAPGYFEDDDLCMKISSAGLRMTVCKNSFIYHAGSQSFAKREDVEELLIAHHRLFIDKYGFDILANADADKSFLWAFNKKTNYTEDSRFNVLIIGDGLGADSGAVKSAYPNANIIAIETDEKLLAIRGNDGITCRSVEELCGIIQNPVFDVLIIMNRGYGMITAEAAGRIAGICTAGCVVIKQNELEDFDISQVKLVIWDMDNTFWHGVLSEENIDIIQQNAKLIRDLADRGIICSVSSKNNESDVLNVLEQLGLADFFVFNNINWDDKGPQIKEKLEDMHLRAANTLFIDDEIRNLEEASFYCPDIMTAQPDFIETLACCIEDIPITDPEHRRLDSYRLLELKRSDMQASGDKKAFLYESDIRVEICTESAGCMAEASRITELIARSNQLNYTKLRDDKNTMEQYLTDDSVRKGYIRVWDKYGEYGIVGFYCFESDGVTIRHFLFSCRIMGMGVVEYVYRLLGNPPINVAEPVSTKLPGPDDTDIDWIHLTESGHNTTAGVQKNNKIKILLKGPCDMSAIENYLIGGDITTEFNFVNDRGFITTGQNHSMNIWEYANLSKDEMDILLKDAPFILKEDFETSIFSKEYDIIALSLLPDCHAGLYRHKQIGKYISFGSVNFDLTDSNNEAGYIDYSIPNHLYPFSHNLLQEFRTKWEFVQTTASDDLIRNLDYIYANVIGEPDIILFLGSEIEYEGENAEFANHAHRHALINRKVKSWAEEHERIHIINATDYIRSQDDYEDCINHYSRNVYYEMATDVVSVINEKVNKIRDKRLHECK